MNRTFPTLKPFYYLEHFGEMLAFLEKNCGTLLGGDERAFIQDFRRLPREGQGLVVRLANRSGCVFRMRQLSYAEIPDIPRMLEVLIEGGFTRRPEVGDREMIFRALTRCEIASLLRPRKGMSAMTKQQLLGLLVAQAESEPRSPAFLDDFVVQARTETLSFLLFLYFGKKRGNLQPLALRDLGIVATRSEQSSFEVRFPSREVALAAYFYAGVSEKISDATEADLLALADGITDWPCEDEPAVVAARHGEICRLGDRLEKVGYPKEAMQVYRSTGSHPARERICRLLFSGGEMAAAKSMLAEMISFPSSDEELLFAEDFRARKFGGKRIGRLTEKLRSAPVVRIDEAFRDSAENAAVRYFMKRGESAFRAENNLWTSLFGLMFWDLLQGEGGETKHNEFEHRPTQLIDGSFFKTHREAIEQRIGLLYSGEAVGHLMSTIKAYAGEPNGVFRWRPDTAQMIGQLVGKGSPDAIGSTLRRIAMDPENNFHGFPDLMVVDGDEIRFVEVKAEGDQIRRHQLVQIEALEASGFRVEILRVGWFADPDQEYVVVDIETTGGRAPFHRITEIGAVKVHRGKITGKFSTLINPDRRIPAKITRLTGIKDAMVAPAPRFPEVAGAFREFVGDAVFVAHSAKFDYGFIRQEFSRMGVDFRRPVLCTVVAMRKYFPGLPSYGLAALTRHFGISLPTHHRALCDAEATAELLKLINGKRHSDN